MPESAFTAVIDHLRAAAQAYADRPALVGPEKVSYGEFYQRVRLWASRLARAGVQRGEQIAIWTSKSVSYVTAIYAAMEAGGTYVPLDGAQPVERAGKIVGEAEPAVLITTSQRYTALAKSLPSSLRLILLLDGLRGGLPVPPAGVVLDAAEPPSRQGHLEFVPPATVGPDDIAAILFTSGSTGVPKGVQISYRNLDAFIGWAVLEFGLRSDDVLANHAGFHFDLSTFDLFAAAASGASVWIVREEEQRDVSALIGGICHHNVTTLYCVPSVLTMLTVSGALTPDVTTGLKRVLFAGEVFPIKHLRNFARQLPETCALYNLYGPTETNVCTFHKVRPSDLHQSKPIAIGLPLPGQKAMLLNERGEAAVAAGELVIEGSCVTPGYFNLADPANSANHKSGRHATGDLAVWEDGVLYYCGRKDRMLKINGNRVELGEIEAALSSLPEIAETAVVGVVTGSGQSLVAFLSPRPGARIPSVIDVKQHCSARLPRYMIPNIVRCVDALPKTPNGKTDYLALRRSAEAAATRPAQRSLAPAVEE